MLRRNLSLIIIATIVVMILIPALVLLVFNLFSKPGQSTPKNPIRVFNHQTGELMKMELEDYLIGVVAQEMPASFEIEALKAQAIAARTYAYRRLDRPDAQVQALDPNADITTDPNLSQAWISEAELRKKWGLWDYLSYRKKIALAVEETQGQVLVYQDQLIDPVYHASCGGGWTENSEEVWKYPFPYLTSVRCSEHREGYYQDRKVISLKEINQALKTKLKSGFFSGKMKVLAMSTAGRVTQIEIDGQCFTGAEVRSKLGLRSTWFTWEIQADEIIFTTRGYGHGVGMCQYGANHLAKEGKTYQEILKHYYTGVELRRNDSLTMGKR